MPSNRIACVDLGTAVVIEFGFGVLCFLLMMCGVLLRVLGWLLVEGVSNLLARCLSRVLRVVMTCDRL